MEVSKSANSSWRLYFIEKTGKQASKAFGIGNPDCKQAPCLHFKFSGFVIYFSEIIFGLFPALGRISFCRKPCVHRWKDFGSVYGDHPECALSSQLSLLP
jgi:hypothetical protein